MDLSRTVAEDLLADAFPQAIACGETLPPGDIVTPPPARSSTFRRAPLLRSTMNTSL